MFQTIHLRQIKEHPSPVDASRSDHLSQVTSSSVNNRKREREKEQIRGKSGKRIKTKTEEEIDNEKLRERGNKKMAENEVGGCENSVCNLIMTKLDLKRQH